MLQQFRKRSGGIFAKIIFGMIIVSFSLFGVGDIFRNYANRKPVATVGSVSISQQEFARLYDTQLRNIKAAYKGKISEEDLKALDLPKRALDSLVTQHLLFNEIQRLGLVVGNDRLAEIVKSNPVFLNEKGMFDQERYRHIVNNTPGGEGALLEALESEAKMAQLFSPGFYGFQLPQAYEEKIYKVLHNRYSFTSLYIPFTAIEVKAQPAEEELMTLYKQNPDIFTKPELRHVYLLVVHPEKVKKSIDLSAPQLQEEYQRRQGDFVKPELRDVLQITFSSKEKALEAQQKLKEGMAPIEGAKKFGGNLQQHASAPREKFSHAHGEIIFSKGEPFVSDVTDSLMGWSIFVVNKIYPQTFKGFEEVKSILETDLRNRLAVEKMDELRNKIEDELAGGQKIQKVADLFQAELINVGPVTDKGLTETRERAIPEAYQTLVLEQLSTLGENMDSAVLDGPEGKMVVVHIGRIIPKTLPAFSDIRHQVVAFWRYNKQSEKASQLAASFVKEATSLEKLKELGKKHNFVVKDYDPMTMLSLQGKKGLDPVIPTGSFQQAFKLTVNKGRQVPALNGVAVLMVRQIQPVDMTADKEKLAKFRQSLKLLLQQDYQRETIKALRKFYPLNLNQEVYDKIVRGEEEKGPVELPDFG